MYPDHRLPSENSPTPCALLRAALLFASVSFAPAALAAPPDPPSAVMARPGNANALVRWTAPVNTSGLLVDSYTVTASPGGATCTSNTGTPVTPACTVTGLTNSTSYTFTVRATTTDGTSVASAASAAVTPLAGTENENLIGTYGAVRWAAGYTAKAINGVDEPFPTGIYNSSSYQPGGDVIYNATDVNSNAGSLTDCTSSWMWAQILCDPLAPSGDPGRNSLTQVYKDNGNVGYTVDTSDGTHSGYVIVDLGSVRSFTTLRVFQMFSDGKVTDVKLSVSSATGNTWPTSGDGSWTDLIPRAPVGAGLDQGSYPGPGYVTCPSIFDFGARNGRYVRLEFWNAGQFGNPSWVEVSAAKLFFENELSTAGGSCPPEPPTGATATAGNATATVYWTPPAGTLTGYALQYSSDGGSSWSTATTVPASVDGAATSAQVTGLVNGTSYVFRVSAGNAAGTSPYSGPTAPVTPSGASLNPPTGVSATAGNASATVTWTGVAGATSYQVTGSPAGSCSATAPTVSCLVSGLTNGLSYTFTVTASDGTTTSPVSAQSNAVTPSGPVNGAPVASSVTIAGTAQVGVLLTGGYTYSDAETDAEGTSLFRWVRNGVNTGVGGGTDVGTGTTYTPVGADEGNYLYFCVTPVASAGTSPGSEACSSATAAVSAAATDDGDGIAAGIEAGVPGAPGGAGAGDGNGDGVPDSLQGNVTSLPAAAGGGYATIVSVGGRTLTAVSAIATPAGLPATVTSPVGAFTFTAIGVPIVGGGASEQFELYLPYNPSITGALKRNRLTGQWDDVATAVTHLGTAKTRITFTLTDGGPYDADGAINGQIQDPVVPIMLAAVSGTGIPTLSEWGALLLSAMVAWLGLGQMRRRGADAPLR